MSQTYKSATQRMLNTYSIAWLKKYTHEIKVLATIKRSSIIVYRIFADHKLISLLNILLPDCQMQMISFSLIDLSKGKLPSPAFIFFPPDNKQTMLLFSIHAYT